MKKYGICRRLYQPLYVDITDILIQYIHFLEPDEIEQLDDDIKANGWGIMSIVDVENSVEVLLYFETFYYFNSRLLLTTGLLPMPDGKTFPAAEKISLKRL